MNRMNDMINCLLRPQQAVFMLIEPLSMLFRVRFRVRLA